MRPLHLVPIGLLAAAIATAAPVPPSTVTADDLARLEGHTLRPVSQDDLLMLSIMVSSVVRGAGADGTMTPELEALSQAARAEAQKGKPTEAFRLAIRLLALLGGTSPGDGLEAATAYDLVLDRKIVVPGEPVHARLEPLFTLDRPLKGTFHAELSLLDPDGAARPAHSVPITALEAHQVAIPTEGLAPGHHDVRYRLLDGGGELLVEGHRDIIAAPGVPARVAALEAKLARIGTMKLEGARQRSAADTAAYFADLIGRATREYVALPRKRMHPMIFFLRSGRSSGADVAEARAPQAAREPFDLDADLALSQELADALLDGTDPFAGRTGDLHLAHRSPIDGSLQPYRAFIPAGYDPARAYPLIIGLHGASGDENAFMERPDFKEEAQKRGYLLATPNGRGPFGGYRGDSGADVLEVLDRMLACYHVDPHQVFLTGHSMGGSGTWRVGFSAPERFAALAPMAGAPSPQQIDLGAAPDMPVLFSAGVEDRVVPVSNLRHFAAAARETLHRFTYTEYPGAGHPDVPRSALVPIFEFFDAQRQQKSDSRGNG